MNWQDATRKKTYDINGTPITLKLSPYVFTPTYNGVAMARLVDRHIDLEQIDQHSTSIVDIGTGTGLLAIVAGKRVEQNFSYFELDVVDPSTEALHLAYENARAHGLEVKFPVTGYDLKRKYDVIVANVPQNILPRDREGTLLASTGKLPPEAVEGGRWGNKIVIDVLRTASEERLKENGQLFICAYSMSSHIETIEEAVKRFDVQIMDVVRADQGDYINSMLDWFLQYQKENPKRCQFGIENGRIFADTYFLKCTRPKQNPKRAFPERPGEDPLQQALIPETEFLERTYVR